MKKGIKVISLSVALFGLIQFIRPRPHEYIEPHKKDDLAGLPETIGEILKNSCFDCHSPTPALGWFDNLTPINFLVDSHIQSGMDALDFSDWNELTKAKQKSILYYGLNKIISGEMPPSTYSFVHRSAKLNGEQIRSIKDYLISISPRQGPDDSPRTAVPRKNKNRGQRDEPEKGYAWVRPAPNGIEYIPGYRDWVAIGSTDRFDNGTIRLIFANPVAVDAIKKQRTNPWPDGSILAKVLWKQKINAQGMVSTGEFVHVEYMIKDARAYAKTQGWGWARWKGDQLRPYGSSASFVNECIQCHKPVRDNDNVFTIPLNPIDIQ